MLLEGIVGFAVIIAITVFVTKFVLADDNDVA